MSIDRGLRPVTDYVRELCRFRHKWDRVDSNHWVANLGDPLTLRCERCGTEFRAQINPNTGLYVRHPRYVYPPGYLYTKEEHKLTPAARRQLLLTQTIQNIRKLRPARRAS